MSNFAPPLSHAIASYAGTFFASSFFRQLTSRRNHFLDLLFLYFTNKLPSFLQNINTSEDINNVETGADGIIDLIVIIHTNQSINEGL